jgi:hypothetical protein
MARNRLRIIPKPPLKIGFFFESWHKRGPNSLDCVFHDTAFRANSRIAVLKD